MQEVFEFLRKCKTYFIATADGDQPKVRPFGTIDIYDGALTIQTGKKKDVSKQIHKNPKVQLCAFDGQQWLRVSATLVEDPRIEAQAHMLESYPELKSMYQPGDGNNEIFKLTNVTADFCSFTAAPRTVEF